MTFKHLFDSRTQILITMSVVLNILFFGVIGGHVYKKWSHHPWHEVKKELSPESRNVIGRTFQSAFRDIKPLGNDARKARAALVKVLSAEKFDGEAFDKAAQRLRDVSNEMKDLKVEATKEVASKLSVEERRKMADRMAKMVGGGHERKVKRHRKPRMIKPDHKPEHADQKK